MIAYVLPNLPETHFVIWGGQAAGIVCAINPLLEGEAIGKLLKAAGASVLVTLAPFRGRSLAKVANILHDAESLRHLVLVNPADRVRGAAQSAARALHHDACAKLYGDGGLRSAVPAHIQIHDFGTAIAQESGTALDIARRIQPGDMSSYFCTGGTTGLPKIAMRSHGNEVANAWSAARFFGDSIGPGKTTFAACRSFTSMPRW